MTTRASIILWSAGSGALLGLFLDLALAGVWMVASAALPAMNPRSFPKWATGIAIVVLAALPVALAVVGYLEGRLKVD